MEGRWLKRERMKVNVINNGLGAAQWRDKSKRCHEGKVRKILLGLLFRLENRSSAKVGYFWPRSMMLIFLSMNN
ncbi:unnamed protein product [Linum tenue]|uniref:Uncharacterized protein n=1 Tax=Linum tenue TaxID=586396 RepID=A0AAV0PWL6_9ROSI|nr:unnamed protein product [Linum tenue]